MARRAVRLASRCPFRSPFPFRQLPAAPAALALSFVLAGVCDPRGAPAATIGGRAGFEVDGVGERYSVGLLDGPFDPGEPIENDLEEEIVRSRESALLALAELRLSVGSLGSSWLDATATGRLGDDRRRASLTVETGLRGFRDRLRIEDRADVQGGSDVPGRGSQNVLTATWDRDSLPLGLRSQVRLGGEWSASSGDSFAAILDYRIFRASAQLGRSLSDRIEARARGGWRRRDSFASSSSSGYDALTTDLEMDGSLAGRDRFDLSLRYEDRQYDDRRGDDPDDPPPGVPSSREAEGGLRLDLDAGRGWKPYTRHRLARQDYARESDAFLDSWSWRGEVGTELSPSGSGASATGILGPAALRLRLGAVTEHFRPDGGLPDSSAFSPEYHSHGALLGISRGALDDLWFDVTLEAGRRDYRRQQTATFDYEGYSLSFSSSDYTYLRLTGLAEWSPRPWLRAEAFVEWDEEIHERKSDDFRLWIVNASLTVPF